MPESPIYVGSPQYENAPICQAVTHAPEGEALPDIVEQFAEDHDAWQEAFFDGWEKMQTNGYAQDNLAIAPREGNLLGVTST